MDDVRGRREGESITFKKQYQGTFKDPLRAIITMVENVLNNLLCKKSAVFIYLIIKSIL